MAGEVSSGRHGSGVVGVARVGRGPQSEEVVVGNAVDTLQESHPAWVDKRREQVGTGAGKEHSDCVVVAVVVVVSGGRERDRQRGSDRQRERVRQTDRERQTDRQRQEERDRVTETGRERQTE